MNAASAVSRPEFERRLYGAIAVLAALVVFTGFARSYYLRSLFFATPLTTLLHVHGAVMSLWYALFLTQVALVATHRVDLHRRLGIAAATCAAVLVPIGAVVAVSFIRRHLSDSQMAAKAAGIAGYDLVVLTAFSVVVVTALALRHRPGVHKRLMLLASVSLLGPPLARLMPGGAAVLVGNSLLVLPIIVDTWRHRRLHPAFGWGGALLLTSSGAAFALALSPAWRSFALHLVV